MLPGTTKSFRLSIKTMKLLNIYQTSSNNLLFQMWMCAQMIIYAYIAWIVVVKQLWKLGVFKFKRWKNMNIFALSKNLVITTVCLSQNLLSINCQSKQFLHLKYFYLLFWRHSQYSCWIRKSIHCKIDENFALETLNLNFDTNSCNQDWKQGPEHLILL